MQQGLPTSGNPSAAGPPVHVVIATHTPRHLALCLAGIGRQTTPPRTVVLSCDSDDPDIARTVQEVWPAAAARLSTPPFFIHTRRPHQGEARLSQVRNNGLRALEDAGLAGSGLVLNIDGDIVLSETAVERHAALAARGAEFIIAYRVNLSPEATSALARDGVRGSGGGTSGAASLVSTADFESLRRRQRRYSRQLRLRKLSGLGLPTKGHKPKAIGCHHAVTVERLRAVNGFDEAYTGYGCEDDDLSRRLHALRPRVRTAIAVDSILALHLWHPSRAPSSATAAPGYGRFAATDLPVRAEHGWENPRPQDTPVVTILAGTTGATASKAPAEEPIGATPTPV